MGNAKKQPKRKSIDYAQRQKKIQNKLNTNNEFLGKYKRNNQNLFCCINSNK